MRIALCQLTSSTDPDENLEAVRDGVESAAAGGARVVVFPEATMARFGAPLGHIATNSLCPSRRNRRGRSCSTSRRSPRAFPVRPSRVWTVTTTKGGRRSRSDRSPPNTVVSQGLSNVTRPLAAVVRATGKDGRGQGNIAATVEALLVDGGSGSSKVTVNTDLDITCRLAKFSRGVINDAATAILCTFAERLGELMKVSTEPDSSTTSAPVRSDEPLDLMRVAKAARANRAQSHEIGGVAAPAALAASVSVRASAIAAFCAGMVSDAPCVAVCADP